MFLCKDSEVEGDSEDEGGIEVEGDSDDDGAFGIESDYDELQEMEPESFRWSQYLSESESFYELYSTDKTFIDDLARFNEGEIPMDQRTTP